MRYGPVNAAQKDADAYVQQQIAVALAEMDVAPLTEAVEGYRARCERNGYDDALSRKMAADLHAALLRMIMR